MKLTASVVFAAVNNPHTKTFVLGTDDFLFLCKRWDDVAKRYEGWKPT
eukprot:SAG31_NODE_24653_length_477_cov_0.677249_1_plen_47_part_10